MAEQRETQVRCDHANGALVCPACIHAYAHKPHVVEGGMYPCTHGDVCPHIGIEVRCVEIPKGVR